MAAYPQHLERERTLFNGRRVIVRPIRADDEQRMRDFLGAISEESLYKRFQKWVKTPSDNLFRYLTAIDYDRHMAVVCAVRRDGAEELIGEARYAAPPTGRRCEFAIIIKDSWRKSGIAGLLMEALIRTAQERGFEAMEGYVLATNRVMLHFARALGFTVEPMEEDRQTLRIVKTLAPAPRPADLGIVPAPARRWRRRPAIAYR